MMQDIDIPLGGNPLEFSMDITDSQGNWKPKLSTFAGHMQFDSHYRNRKCSFGDTDIFYNIRREDMWDGESPFYLVLVVFFLNHNSFCSFHTLQLAIKIFRNSFAYIHLFFEYRFCVIHMHLLHQVWLT